MKPRQIDLLLTIAAMVITLSTGTPIPWKETIESRGESDERKGEERISLGDNVISACLRIAPDLPPCNFDSEATWRSRSGGILHGDPAGAGYPLGELPDFLADGSDPKILHVEPSGRKDGIPISTGDGNLEDFHFFENDLAFTVVYYLEGCLPARLPFDLPSCPVDELQAIQMNKLVPFQLPDVQDPLIFPEIDVKQIEFSHRQSRAPQASQSHENSEGDEKRMAARVGGVQDFHKTIPKSNTMLITGAASAKYVSKLQASVSTIMISGQRSSTSVKNREKPLPRIGKGANRNPDVEGIDPGSIGSRELTGGKNRVQ